MIEPKRLTPAELKESLAIVAVDNGYHTELIEDHIAALEADLADADKYREALRSAHNGYDPVMRAAMPNLKEPATPFNAIESLLEDAHEQGKIEAGMILRRDNFVVPIAKYPPEHCVNAVTVVGATWLCWKDRDGRIVKWAGPVPEKPEERG